MMYKNKMAVALKHKGKVLREFKDEVFVPFGAEYSIFIKNLNSVKALVKVTIDGVDVGDGTKFVVDANDTIDIERFIKNGNFEEGNRLKFIERTGKIEDHRGVGIEDGLVRVEFQFEKPYVAPYIPPYRPSWPNDNIWYTYSAGTPQNNLIGGSSDKSSNRGILRGASFTAASASVESNAQVSDTVNVNYAAQEILNEVENDVGITVPGSISDQEFKTASWFPVESETHVVVLKILGETKDNVKVKKAVTVRTKLKCGTCGHNNKATAKFCSECGTSLKIV